MSMTTDAVVSPWRLRLRRFRRHRTGMAALALLVLLVLFCLAAWPLQALLGVDATTTDLLGRFDPPGPVHWLGTDDAGRDVLVRLMIGGQVSLLVGLIATVVGAVVGVLIGVAAGYVGGATDGVADALHRWRAGPAVAAPADRAGRAGPDEAGIQPGVRAVRRRRVLAGGGDHRPVRLDRRGPRGARRDLGAEGAGVRDLRPRQRRQRACMSCWPTCCPTSPAR